MSALPREPMRAIDASEHAVLAEMAKGTTRPQGVDLILEDLHRLGMTTQVNYPPYEDYVLSEVGRAALGSGRAPDHLPLLKEEGRYWGGLELIGRDTIVALAADGEVPVGIKLCRDGYWRAWDMPFERACDETWPAYWTALDALLGYAMCTRGMYCDVAPSLMANARTVATFGADRQQMADRLRRRAAKLEAKVEVSAGSETVMFPTKFLRWWALSDGQEVVEQLLKSEPIDADELFAALRPGSSAGSRQRPLDELTFRLKYWERMGKPSDWRQPS